MAVTEMAVTEMGVAEPAAGISTGTDRCADGGTDGRRIRETDPASLRLPVAGRAEAWRQRYRPVQSGRLRRPF